MLTNCLLNINNLADIEFYKEKGFTTFLFALEGFSIGYEKSFKVEDVNNFTDSYVLINCLLNTSMVKDLKKILPLLKIKGIVYEDLAVYNLVKELNLDLELILFQNHFATNSESINYLLEFNDSVVVSNELTISELENIVSEVKKKVVVHLFGYNQAMYSRRSLISNYTDNYKLPSKSKTLLKETVGGYEFLMTESDLGTVIYDNHIFFDKRLLELDVLYFYINTSYIEKEKVIDILSKDGLFSGFLDKRTVFKIEEVRRNG